MNDLSGRDRPDRAPIIVRCVVDSRLSKPLKAFGAVEIVTKWRGRYGPLSRSRSVDRLDDVAVFAAAQTDLIVLMGEEPHLVDECKMYRKFGMPSSP